MNKATHSTIKILILVAIIALGGYWFYSNSVGTSKSNDLLTNISEKVLVTSEVAPKVVTLTTIEQLRGQSFFRQAALGDVIVMYPDSVILYRPSVDKIITMGTLDPAVSAQLFRDEFLPQQVTAQNTTLNGQVSNQTPETSTTNTTQSTTENMENVPEVPAAPKSVVVEVRNGTATNGLAKKIANKLASSDMSITVPVTGNASSATYSETMIVNMTGESLSPFITKTIKDAKVVTELPMGEKPLQDQAKVLVIIGADIAKHVDGI